MAKNFFVGPQPNRLDRGVLDLAVKTSDAAYEALDYDAITPAIYDLNKFLSTTEEEPHVYPYGDNEIEAVEGYELMRMGGSPFRAHSQEIFDAPVIEPKSIDELVKLVLAYVSSEFGINTDDFKLSPTELPEYEADQSYAYLDIANLDNKLLSITSHRIGTYKFHKGSIFKGFIPERLVDYDDYAGLTFHKLPLSLAKDTRSYLSKDKWYTSFEDNEKTVEIFGATQKVIKTRVAIYRALMKYYQTKN